MKVKILYISILALFLTNFSLAQVPASEKAALQALYNATDGANWTNNTGWDFSTPVTSWNNTTQTGWYGITIGGGNVTLISLVNNNLIGSIPSELGVLSSLIVLNLPSNNLTGSIPSTIGNLSGLVSLSLNINQLTGNIPSTIGNLSSLETLFLHINQLSGSIPPSFGGLTSLKKLNLYDNQLNGNIPSSLGNLTKLTTLDLGKNQLIGSIPLELGNLNELISLNFAPNQLSGNIPPELGNLSNIKVIKMSNNRLTGSIPRELGNLDNLVLLWLYNNQLSGSIPPELGNLSSIKSLELNINQLTGSIPSELGNLPNLDRLYLLENKLSGKIPFSLINLPELEQLLFRTNAFRFIDFESEHVEYLDNLVWYLYNPQAKIDVEETSTVIEGGDYTFTMFTDNYYSTNNTYQWYKGSAAISGATNRTYTIANVTPADAGDYYCLANNTIVNGLTLRRNPVHLVIENCTPIEGTIIANTNEYCINASSQFSFDTTATIDSYEWTFFGADGVTPVFTSTAVTPEYTYVTPGIYDIRLITTNNQVCTQMFTMNITVSDCQTEPSCTENNPNSEVVKSLFLDLLNHLKEKQINNEVILDGYTSPELTALTPYITEPNPKIYNFSTNNIGGMNFSFSPEHNEDVSIYLWPNATDYRAGDMDLSNYISSNDPAKVYYYYESTGALISVRNHYVKHIDFCPSEIVEPSCTENNPNSEIVKGLFIDLLRHLTSLANTNFDLPRFRYYTRWLYFSRIRGTSSLYNG